MVKFVPADAGDSILCEMLDIDSFFEDAKKAKEGDRKQYNKFDRIYKSSFAVRETKKQLHVEYRRLNGLEIKKNHLTDEVKKCSEQNKKEISQKLLETEFELNHLSEILKEVELLAQTTGEVITSIMPFCMAVKKG